jgi:hypothetical protein
VPSGTRVVKTFTSSSTFTPPAATSSTNPLLCDVVVTGSGGGGAGGTPSGSLFGGGGGNAGQSLAATMAVTGSVSVTVGAAGGAGGQGASGSAGNASSFGALSATGGTGGTISAAPRTATSLMPTSSAGGLPNGGRLYVMAGGSTTLGATSPDGVTWTSMTMPSATAWPAIGYGNGLFLAITDASSTGYATSPNGVTWTARSFPVPPTTTSWGSTSVQYGNGRWLVLGYTGVTATVYVMSSTDGINWVFGTLPNPGASNYWQYARFAGDYFWAFQGLTATTIASSPDGITWTSVGMPANAVWTDVAYGNRTYLVTAQGTSTAGTSTDGFINVSTTRTLPASTLGYAVHNGTNFIVTPVTGTSSAYSADGASWNSISLPISPTTAWTPPVVADGRVIIADSGGSRVCYLDTTSWTATSAGALPSTYTWKMPAARSAFSAVAPAVLTSTTSTTPSGGAAGNTATSGDGGAGGNLLPPTATSTATSAAATAGQVPGAGGGGGGVGATSGAAGGAGLVTVSYYQP